jgi:hypothetical protein
MQLLQNLCRKPVQKKGRRKAGAANAKAEIGFPFREQRQGRRGK